MKLSGLSKIVFFDYTFSSFVTLFKLFGKIAYSEYSILSPGSSAPGQKKIHKKFQKFQKKFRKVCNWCVRCSKFQIILTFELLSTTKKLGQNSMRTIFFFTDPKFVFFTESYSDVQVIWNSERTSRIKLSTMTKKGFLQFF